MSVFSRVGPKDHHHIKPLLADISLAQGLAGPLALRIPGPQGIAVDITAVFFIETLDIAAVFPVDFIGGGKEETLRSKIRRQIQQVVQADDIGDNRPDGIIRVGDRVRVARRMEDIMKGSLPAIRQGCSLPGRAAKVLHIIDIAADKGKIIPPPVLSQPLMALFLVPSEGGHAAAKSVPVIPVHQDLYQGAPDHAGRAGDQKAFSLQFLPGQGQI